MITLGLKFWDGAVVKIQDRMTLMPFSQKFE